MMLLFVPTLLALCPDVASAQVLLPLTYVSEAIGNDANNCDRRTPCRSFVAAHTNTAPGGKIIVLDPGSYGPLTITKSITIIGESTILVYGGGTGITINAPATADVYLRGLTIQGIGFGGGTGLRFNSGRFLTLQNCIIRNHTGNGIDFVPTGDSNFYVSNSAVADNGGNGISISPMGSSAVVNVVLNRVEAYNNSFNGVFVGGTSTAMINAVVRESVAANSGVGGGFRVDSAGAATGLMVIRSLVANNNWGFLALNSNGTIQVSESTVTGNTTSWSIGTGAVLQSYADNNINGNADGDPAPTIVAKK